MTPDEEFFAAHRDRQAHIRKPILQQHIDNQRSVRWLDECELQFRSLGPHDRNRRRIIAYRVPADNPMYDRAKPQILQIPFLLFADETVEDEDRGLLPIVHQIMMDAARGMV